MEPRNNVGYPQINATVHLTSFFLFALWYTSNEDVTRAWAECGKAASIMGTSFFFFLSARAAPVLDSVIRASVSGSPATGLSRGQAQNAPSWAHLRLPALRVLGRQMGVLGEEKRRARSASPGSNNRDPAAGRTRLAPIHSTFAQLSRTRESKGYRAGLRGGGNGYCVRRARPMHLPQIGVCSPLHVPSEREKSGPLGGRFR